MSVLTSFRVIPWRIFYLLDPPTSCLACHAFGSRAQQRVCCNTHGWKVRQTSVLCYDDGRSVTSNKLSYTRNSNRLRDHTGRARSTQKQLYIANDVLRTSTIRAYACTVSQLKAHTKELIACFAWHGIGTLKHHVSA